MLIFSFFSWRQARNHKSLHLASLPPHIGVVLLIILDAHYLLLVLILAGINARTHLVFAAQFSVPHCIRRCRRCSRSGKAVSSASSLRRHTATKARWGSQASAPAFTFFLRSPCAPTPVRPARSLPPPLQLELSIKDRPTGSRGPTRK